MNALVSHCDFGSLSWEISIRKMNYLKTLIVSAQIFFLVWPKFSFLTLKSHLDIPEAVDKLIGATRRIVKKQEYVATLAVKSSV